MATLPTVFGCESEIMVEELPELHDHVGETCVGDIVVGMVLLADPPRTRQTGWVAPATRNVSAVVVPVWKESERRRVSVSQCQIL